MKTYRVITCFLLILFFSCTIKDGTRDCDLYVRFIYDYNLHFVDLFPQQGEDMNLYVFDQKNQLYGHISDYPRTIPEDYKMYVPLTGNRQTYQFVAWSGLEQQTYSRPEDWLEELGLQGLVVSLGNSDTNVINSKLPNLWHGKIVEEAGGDSDEVKTISLVKNTNVFRVIIQDLAGHALTIDNFEIEVHSSNTTYDHENNILDDRDEIIIYQPYHTEDDENAGAIAELNTLRLMTDRENTLFLKNKISGQVIKIPLNTYLNALRLQEYSNMDLQEYLDRQDSYYIVFFLTFDGWGYFSANISINGWYIREQEEDE